MASGGFVGILSVDLQLPSSTSLKAKRKELRRLKDGLARRFACSVAEVDYHDLWQRTRLTLALVSRTAGETDERLDGVSRWVHSDPAFVVVGETRELVEGSSEDATVAWGSG